MLIVKGQLCYMPWEDRREALIDKISEEIGKAYAAFRSMAECSAQTYRGGRVSEEIYAPPGTGSNVAQDPIDGLLNYFLVIRGDEGLEHYRTLPTERLEEIVLLLVEG